MSAHPPSSASWAEGIARWSVTNRLGVLFATFTLFLGGLFYARTLRLDALPDVTGVQVVVLTRAPGLTPEEVEQRVTRPLEVSLGGLPGASTQRSLSRYGISAITVVFQPDVDLVRARVLVAERIANVELPPEVTPPELGPMSGGLGEIFQFSVVSRSRPPSELLEITELRIAPLLRSVPGVVEVNTWGGARRTLDVVGDPIRMAARGVTLSALAQATERAVGTSPGASLPAGASHVLLRGRSLPTSQAELASGQVRNRSGELVRFSDVARIEDGFVPRIGLATANGGGQVVYVMCQMLTGANALEVMQGLHTQMALVRQSLPEDVHIDVAYDRSRLVNATLRTVGSSLLEGGVLVFLVLLVLLGSVRAGTLVASVIPLSMVAAAVWMVIFGIPGNLMSLGALDFGLIVDGAVVVVEATFHALVLRRLGAALTQEDFRLEIATSAASVAKPVAFSVAIIALVYVPILALSGVEGVMFRPMALTVVFALLSSLVLSLTYVPAFLATFLRIEHVPQDEPRIVRFASRIYGRLLATTMHRAPLLGGLVVLGVVLGGALLMTRGTEFIPTLDEGDIVILTTRASDISIDRQEVQATLVENAVHEIPEVISVTHRIGSPTVATDTMGIEQADVFVTMRPKAEWRHGMTREAMMSLLEERVRTVDGAVALGFTHPIQMRFNELLGGSTSDVSLSISGPDLAELQRLADRVSETISHVPGAVDVRVTSPPSVPLLDVQPRALDAAQHGFDARDVLDVVTAQRTGLTVARTYEGPLMVPVRVRLGGTQSSFDLAHAQVPTDHGSLVALDQLADVVLIEAPALVDHDQGERRIVIAFNVRGRDLGSVVAQAQADVNAAVQLPRGYLPRWGGQSENLADARQRLAVVTPVVLLGVLLLLWQALGRWKSALLVFANVPFAAVGGICLLSLRGMPISISAAIGFIALSGIAVMNGVVLITKVQEEEEAGFEPLEAARRAAESRMRPVMMTALVAALGFVPMMISHGVGAEVQAPLATVVVGGLLTSTLLTLFALPALYARLNRPSTRSTT